MDDIKVRTKNLIHPISFITTGQIHKKESYHLDYEGGVCRQEDLVKVIRDSVIFFALTQSELASLDAGTSAKLYSRAWNRISSRPKEKKGDYGELLLFLLLEVFYPAKKFVTKVRLRSSKGDEIKGYDCAHFSIDKNDEINLWLGEAKFHQSFSTAINKAAASIRDHIRIKSIKDEISILEGNIDIQGKDAERLENFLNSGISIDKMQFKIPILLTYDSKVVKSHKSICKKFVKDLENELGGQYSSIEKQTLKVPKNVELHFILLALETVSKIKDALEKIERAMK